MPKIVIYISLMLLMLMSVNAVVHFGVGGNLTGSPFSCDSCDSKFWRLDGTNAPPTADWDMGGFSFFNVNNISGTGDFNTTGRICDSTGCIPSGGGNPFDQSLNTTDNVMFRNISSFNGSLNISYGWNLFGVLDLSKGLYYSPVSHILELFYHYDLTEPFTSNHFREIEDSYGGMIIGNNNVLDNMDYSIILGNNGTFGTLSNSIILTHDNSPLHQSAQSFGYSGGLLYGYYAGANSFINGTMSESIMQCDDCYVTNNGSAMHEFFLLGSDNEVQMHDNVGQFVYLLGTNLTAHSSYTMKLGFHKNYLMVNNSGVFVFQNETDQAFRIDNSTGDKVFQVRGDGSQAYLKDGVNISGITTFNEKIKRYGTWNETWYNSSGDVVWEKGFNGTMFYEYAYV